jgi:hypothetical protein
MDKLKPLWPHSWPLIWPPVYLTFSSKGAKGAKSNRKSH